MGVPLRPRSFPFLFPIGGVGSEGGAVMKVVAGGDDGGRWWWQQVVAADGGGRLSDVSASNVAERSTCLNHAGM